VTGQVARKHHFVPEFYLAGFTASGSKGDYLYAFDQVTLKQWKARPAERAHQRDFYRIDLPGVPPDAIERAFAEFEGLAAPVINRMTATLTMPSGRDFSILMNLVAWLAVKVPGVRSTITDAVNRVGQQVLRLMVSTPERWHTILERARADGVELGGGLDYESMKVAIEGGQFQVSVGNRNWFIRQILSMMDAILPYLVTRRWSILVPEDDAGYFICSDRPVTLVWSTDDRQRIPPGFGMRDTQVTMPLTKTIALLGEFQGTPKTAKIGRLGVAGLNSRTAMYAERCLYATADDFPWVHKDGSIRGAKELLEAWAGKRGAEVRKG
jgi:hypothetical protein